MKINNTVIILIIFDSETILKKRLYENIVQNIYLHILISYYRESKLKYNMPVEIFHTFDFILI